MSWQLSLSCTATEAHKQLEEKVKEAKKSASDSECEHIDAAVALFKHLVPNEPELSIYFSVAGHSPHGKDISFNSTCSVFKS